MSIKIELDQYSTEDVKAIQMMHLLGFSDEEIQAKYDRQKEIDKSSK